MIPYGRQCIEDDDVAAVAEVLRGDFLTGGPAVEAFEAGLAAAVGAPFAVASSNGTTALHLAMLALGIGPGDAVVVPTLTFLATANAARYVGADVWFADVDADTGLLTADTLRRRLQEGGPGTPKAVVPVHLSGQCVAMDEILAVAADHGLAVVEDACHAIGGAYEVGGRRIAVGGSGGSAMTCFSFHPVKTIAMGEGGAVTTAHPVLAERLRRLRNHGMVRDAAAMTQPEEARDADGAPNPWYYEMPELGFNYRASDLQCALGASQLRKLDRFMAARRGLAALYDEALAPLAPAIRPVPRRAADDGWHLYAVLVDFPAIGISRARLMNALRERGIGTQVHYLPVHRQPYYRGLYGRLDLPGADAYYARCLSLPLYPAMTPDMVETVVRTLADIMGAAG